MKLLSFLILLSSTISAFCSSIIVYGNVSGTWDADTVLVAEDITVQEADELCIEPGTRVEFAGSYKVLVYGSIKAIGIENDSVMFCYGGTEGGWAGIKYPDDPLERDSSIFDYCIFTGANSVEAPRSNDGAVLTVFNAPKFRLSNSRLTENQGDGLGIVHFQNGSKGMINNNVIAYNSANYHALFIGEYCEFTVTHNKICNNYGGGLTVIEHSNSLVINNLITNNFATIGGGVVVIEGSISTFINNTICQNRATYGGGMFFAGPFACNVVNCIITGNQAQEIGPQIILEDPMADPYFINCNIQGGPEDFDGEGTGANYSLLQYINNIDENPMFVDPEPCGNINGHGLRGDWSLQTDSPCIDTGENDSGGHPAPIWDLSGQARVVGENIDMGAYEWQDNGIWEDCKMVGSCTEIKLSNHPNPFNPTTTICFELKKPETVSLKIFNIRGQLVRTLAEEEQFEAGHHSLVWDGKDSQGNKASSGVYFYRLHSGEDAVAKKMILLK